MDKSNIWVSWLGVFANGWRPTKAGWDGGCVQDMKFNEPQFRKFIEQARFYGANGCRIFPYECKWVTKHTDMFSPVMWDDIQKAWDLHKFNPAYFDALDKVIEIANSNNIKVMFSCFDNCQRHRTKQNKLYAPWLNNVQGIPLYMSSIYESKKWIDKIVGRYGNKINYEICNEYSRESGYSVAEAALWLAQMADHLIQSNVPPGNICWGATPTGTYKDGKFTIDPDRDLTVQACRVLSNMIDKRTGKRYRDTLPQAQDLLWCTVHNIGVYPKDPQDEHAAVQMWGDNHTRKFIASTDGQSNGNSLLDCEEDGTWRRGDEAETYSTCRYLMAHDGGQFGKVQKVTIELLPSNTNPEAWIFGALGAAMAYRDSYGAYPKNWHTKPTPPAPPVDPPVPPVPPTPPAPEPPIPEPGKPPFNWNGWWNNNEGYVIAIGSLVMFMAFFIWAC